MRITIFGATGLLGKALLHDWKEDDVAGFGSKDADIRDAARVSAVVERTRPEWIVLAAAYTDVDGCESKPQLALDVNCRGAANVAQAAKKIGSRLLFLSTDYVFDGKKTSPYETTDPRAPRSAYGRSKAEAEIAVTQILPQACIVRTSWLFGTGGRCFPETILKLAAARPAIDVVNDQRGSPTYAPDLAQAIKQLCHNDASGMVHVTNRGECTWFDFAREIVARAASPTQVRPTSSDKFVRTAERPQYSVLSPRSLEPYGITMPSWQNALVRYLDDRQTIDRTAGVSQVSQEIQSPIPRPVPSPVPNDDALVVGVDIGGTKVAAGLVNARGEIKRHSRAPMAATGSADDGVAAVISAIDSLFAGDAPARTLVRGIGVCSPGPLDPKTGVVINPPNLPCWRNFPLADRMSQHFDVPVKVDNDGNAAALAEARWGAGHGYRNVFYATIGTGIGTGIVFDGRIYHGRTGAAAEGGHVSIDYRGPRCACGKHGCIEVLAAGPAIARRARAKVAADPARGTAILSLAKGSVEAVSSEMVGQAYAAGDPLAEEILRETIELLAQWLGTIIDLLEPDVIIMGGGVAAMLVPFFGEIRDRLPACSINPRCQEIPIVKAFYGADAGIAGGAALCWTSDAGV